MKKERELSIGLLGHFECKGPRAEEGVKENQ
jgi:hypothetical protein